MIHMVSLKVLAPVSSGIYVSDLLRHPLCDIKLEGVLILMFLVIVRVAVKEAIEGFQSSHIMTYSEIIFLF